VKTNPSVLPVTPFHRIQEPLRVVADAVLEDDFDVFNIGNLLGRIALDHHEVQVSAEREVLSTFCPKTINDSLENFFANTVTSSAADASNYATGYFPGL
jgi:hypothetical protein